MRTNWDKGFIQVYTGEGKGKTTAAIGLALRAAGAGLNVFICQFAKSGDYSELVALRRMADLVEVAQFGSNCFLTGEPTADDVAAARKGLDRARRVLADGKHRLVILDEANIATYFGLFPVDELLDLIDAKPDHVELVITGRRADPRVIQRADLVTEMREIKHYYQTGIQARRGIEK